MPLTDAKLTLLLELDDANKAALAVWPNAVMSGDLASRWLVEVGLALRPLVEELLFCRREMELAGRFATAKDDEIERLRSVNAKLVEACKAATRHSIGFADKCRAALEAAKDGE